MKPLRFLGLVGAAALLLAGCSTAEYYWQGISGQLELLSRAQPIPDVIETANDPLIKRKLERVLAIRDYASRQLGLPDNAATKALFEFLGNALKK